MTPARARPAVAPCSGGHRVPARTRRSVDTDKADSGGSVLKKIPVAQLELGMFLHSFEGHWVNHPFWRTAFVLGDAALLARARAARLGECWIDVSLGADVGAAHAPAAPTPAPVVHPAAPTPTARAVPATSMAEELARASRLCRTAAARVQHLFEEARLGHALASAGCAPLVHEIAASVARNPGALVSLARLKTADDYSHMHSVAVCALMIALARQLGLDDAACREAGLAGLLHDIGKAVIPPAILNKPGKLDDAEFATIRTHPERGHELLRDGSGASAGVLDVCLHHHERVDGKGYPHRLAGADISLLARMGAVCDVYDAVTSDRPYKAGWDPADALAQMAQWEGHFDPALISAFVHGLGVYPVGSLVRLESQRIAVVVQHNANAITRPLVKAFFSQRSRMPIPPEAIDLAAAHCNDRIAGRESTEGWNQRDIAALWAGEALPRRFKAPARAAQRRMTVR